MNPSFKKHTESLTRDELELMPIIIDGFKRHQGRFNAIVGKDIVKSINRPEIMAKFNIKAKTTEVRLRKIVNHLRTNKILPIIATQDGYFMSYQPEDIRGQIESLQSRIEALQGDIKGLQHFITPTQAKMEL